MTIRKEIKRSCLKPLKGHALTAIVFIFIMLFIFSVFPVIEYLIYSLFGINGYIDGKKTSEFFLDDTINSSLIAILITFVVSLIQYMLLSILSFISDGFYYRVVGFEKVFFPKIKIRYIIKAYFLSLSVLFRTIMITLFYCIPGITALMYSIFVFSNEGVFSAQKYATIGLSVVFIILGCVFGFINTRKFFLVKYLFIENPREKTRKLIKASKQHLKKNKALVSIFYFSFIPLFLSCIFILPIFYVVPLFSSAKAVYARYLIGLSIEQNKIIELKNNKAKFKDTYKTQQFKALSS